MDNETIESFAKYRLNKAKETLETAERIFKEGKGTSVILLMIKNVKK